MDTCRGRRETPVSERPKGLSNPLVCGAAAERASLPLAARLPLGTWNRPRWRAPCRAPAPRVPCARRPPPEGARVGSKTPARPASAGR